MRLRKVLSILVCLCTMLSLCSCTLLINKFKVETKDLNGEDDFSLAVLTDEDICAEDNVCYCVAFGLNTSGSKSYADEDYFHDGDTVEASAATPLSGVSLLQWILLVLWILLRVSPLVLGVVGFWHRAPRKLALILATVSTGWELICSLLIALIMNLAIPLLLTAVMMALCIKGFIDLKNEW